MTLTTLLSSVIISLLPASNTHCIDWYGYYEIQNETRQIFICKWIGKEYSFTKYHELGHHFWYTYMTEEQKAEYKKEFEKVGEDIEEDFADNFARMIQKKHTRKTNLIRLYFNSPNF